MATLHLDNPFGATAPVATVPLQGPHVATISATLTMDQSTISGWLDSLPTLKGFVDVTPTSVVAGTGTDYVVSITMHINSDALANRFTKDAGTTK